jgi:hypothetical protein
MGLVQSFAGGRGHVAPAGITHRMVNWLRISWSVPADFIAGGVIAVC